MMPRFFVPRVIYANTSFCPKSNKVTSHLIDALVKLGRREEALAYCQRAINVVPDSKKLQQLQKKLSLVAD